MRCCRIGRGSQGPSRCAPPVNSLGHALRAGIVQGLDKAAEDPTVKALVLIGAAETFSGGADIREINTPKSSARPTLSDINDAQDRFPKPMVGAIGAFALGGGLELALGCHYRVAATNAELALPEVKLGILPGSGGTQRLPRAIPTVEALDMLVSGSRIGGAKARVLGLLDELIDGDLCLKTSGTLASERIQAVPTLNPCMFITRTMRFVPQRIRGLRKTYSFTNVR